jgi:hypothetical protein
MTPARGTTDECHDTLINVTGRSGKGTARQTVRIDEELWKKLGEACEKAGIDRSAALRAFSRWYAGEEGAELPERPSPE